MESTDLTKIYDHPAVVLRAAADQAVSKIPALPEEKAEARSLHVAAATLDTFERENNVTFAALSNEALASIREAYAKHIDAPYCDGSITAPALRDVLDAINALLGLDNQ